MHLLPVKFPAKRVDYLIAIVNERNKRDIPVLTVTATRANLAPNVNYARGEDRHI